MKVYFPGPMPETYHPKLGKLVKDKVFELPADRAGLYIKAGLLRRSAGAGKESKAGTAGSEKE